MTVDSEHEILKKEVYLSEIIEDRESSNGNTYHALVLPSGEWVFVWSDDWREEISRHRKTYLENKVELLYVDKEEEEGEHFYNFKAMTPVSKEKTRELFIENVETARKKNAEQKQVKTPDEDYRPPRHTV